MLPFPLVYSERYDLHLGRHVFPAQKYRLLTKETPVAIVLAGGYAESEEDTVTIHTNTAEVARDVLVKVGWPGRVPR